MMDENNNTVGSLSGTATSAPSQPTRAFGAVEDADASRQSQHMEANDTPIDVNLNAVVAREQALTFSVAGQMFTANADVRAKLQDQFLARQALK